MAELKPTQYHLEIYIGKTDHPEWSYSSSMPLLVPQLGSTWIGSEYEPKFKVVDVEQFTRETPSHISQKAMVTLEKQ